MRTIVVVGPRLSTQIAKIMPTNTSNVVAPLLFFDDDSALTLLVVEIFLQKFNLVFVAVPLVLLKQTFAAENSFASIAGHCSILANTFLNDPVAGIGGTQFHIIVLMSHVKLVNVVVPVLNSGWELLEKCQRGVYGDVAGRVGTGDFLKLVDSVESVLVHAVLAVVMFVLAVT